MENPAYTLAANFIDLLTEEGERCLTTLPDALLTREQVQRLRRILDHFETKVDEDDEMMAHDNNNSTDALERHGDVTSISESSHAQVMAGIESQTSTAPRQTPLLAGIESQTSTAPRQTPLLAKKRGRPSNASPNASSKRVNIFSKSWGAILAVEQFTLDGVLQRYLASDPSEDVASFFEADLPELNEPDQHDLAKFLEFCQKVDKMPRRIDHKSSNVSRMDHVRRLFLWVTVGDLANHILGVDWSNTKKRELKTTIANSLEEDDRTALLKKLHLAAQVTFICRNLGMGALFWLPDQLTDHFLQKKVTRTGDSLQEMMRHVRSRGLPQSIQTSGAKGIGNAIRAYLCSQYSIEEENSVAVQLPEDLVDGSGSGSG